MCRTERWVLNWVIKLRIQAEVDTEEVGHCLLGVGRSLRKSAQWETAESWLIY